MVERVKSLGLSSLFVQVHWCFTFFVTILYYAHINSIVLWLLNKINAKSPRIYLYWMFWVGTYWVRFFIHMYLFKNRIQNNVIDVYWNINCSYKNIIATIAINIKKKFLNLFNIFFWINSSDADVTLRLLLNRYMYNDETYFY